MDHRPIGVFDSGLGGLTSVKELRRILPNEDIVYFGDTGRVPYGGRATDTLVRFAEQDIRFLLSFDVKAVLIACGTVSSLLHLFSDRLSVPTFGVSEATAEAAAAATENGRVGVIATAAAIASGRYQQLLRESDRGLELMAFPCPLFVPLVENGRIHPGDIVIETVAEEYLAPMRAFGCDTLILGCTHYPLLADVISGVLPGVRLIDSGREASLALQKELQTLDLLSDRTERGSIRYYVSADPSGFAEIGSLFLEQTITESVERIEIEAF